VGAENPSTSINVLFVIGGVDWQLNDNTMEMVTVPYPDSLPRTNLGTKALHQDWQRFEAPLTELEKSNLQCVLGGFGWVISWSSNRVIPNDTQSGPARPRHFILELRNIQYDR
jgi:hypothetical protein